MRRRLFTAGFLLAISIGAVFVSQRDVVYTQNVSVDATVPAICGNATVEGAESCDGAALNGATCETAGDFTGGDLSCAADCTFDTSDCTADGGGAPAPVPPPPPPPPPPVCGNGLVEAGEACDDGNANQGDGCFACQVEVAVCGNGVLEFAEGCDDGNLAGGDGCSAACQIEVPVCGNNIVENGEACDDGNIIDGDGCNNQCVIEQAVCGNNIVENGEACDDGNVANGDRCDNQCQIEVPPAVCGNAQVEQGEQCDDGNIANGDGCDNQCQVEVPAAICGNGQVEQGEQCDDGNLNNGDGCNAFCAVEQQVPPPVQPPGPGPAVVGNGGGGDIDREEIQLNKVLFWVAQRSVQVFPDDARQVKSLLGDVMTIALPAVAIPHQGVRRLILQTGGQSYAMTFNAADGRYYADVPLREAGVFEARVLVSYDDGTQDSVDFRILALAPGTVSNKEGDRIDGAEIQLFNAQDQLVDMVQFGQQNPVVTGANGTYGFVVPNGNYKLVIEKEGYRTKETFSFRVDQHVINRQIELIKEAKNIEEALAELGDDANNVEKVAVVAEVVTEQVVEQAQVVAEAVVDVVKKVDEVADDPAVEAAVEEVVAPTAVGVSAAIVVPSLWSTMIPFLRYLFLQPLLLLGRKKRREWGTVYNSLTKLPIDLAVVRLVDAKNNRIKQSRVTDMNGRYLFIAEPGEYKIEVTKQGFVFPTSTLKGVTEDGDFIDLYHGESIAVEASGSNITPNIPIDPPGAEKTPKRVTWEKRLRLLQHIISITGIVFAAVSFYITPSILVGSFLAIHVLMYAGFTRFVKPKKPKGWGIVYDKDNKSPLAGVAVRLFTKEYNKLVATQVTDKKGRYAFLVGPNTYYVTSEKTGYSNYKSDDIAIAEKDKQSFLKQDVAMGKGADKAEKKPEEESS